MNLREKYRRFKVWQQNPFDYSLSKETHKCHNCGNEFTGNYCPCCSQKAGFGPVTWNSVWQNVLEIWGVGSRSMLFSLWQLIWRPGYLIGDYINGKRQVSFPPVKMLLIVAIIITLFERWLLPAEPEVVHDAYDSIYGWADNNQGWGFLVLCSIMILPTWILFHHAPRNTAHSLPQGFFIQVFMSIMILIVSLLCDFFEMELFMVATIILYIYSYRQLFGYGIWGTSWRVILSFVVFLLLLTMSFLFLGDNNVKNNGVLMLVGIASLLALLIVIILAIGYLISKKGQEKEHTRGEIVVDGSAG